MANFRNLKGGSVSSKTKLKSAILHERYYRVERIDASNDLWEITLVDRILGNKFIRFNSERHCQMCLESLRAGDPPVGFHIRGY